MQLNPDGSLAHLLTLEGLPLSTIHRLFSLADFYTAGNRPRRLSGKLIVHIFFESSTRTRTAFEAAAKQLGADVVNLDQTRMASATKSETLQDTIRTVAAMGAAGIVLRHGEDGAAQEAAASAAGSAVKIINGGDGCNAHPTQGLTDAYTLQQEISAPWSKLSVAIVGDVLHSRVARSNLHILQLLGVQDIRLTGPEALCPPSLADTLGTPVIAAIDDAIADADVIMLLRIQRERIAGHISDTDYLHRYGLTEARAAALKSSAVIMHPGPINRGIEIADSVADSPHSLILKQIYYGMAIRMAVLTDLIAD